MNGSFSFWQRDLWLAGRPVWRRRRRRLQVERMRVWARRRHNQSGSKWPLVAGWRQQFMSLLRLAAKFTPNMNQLCNNANWPATPILAKVRDQDGGQSSGAEEARQQFTLANCPLEWWRHLVAHCVPFRMLQQLALVI